MTSGQAELSGEGVALASRACALCPRRCGVDRAAGVTGFCGAGERVKLYRYGPHFGEEPPISGSRGSGTLFFSHCTLACIYCQNYPWSQEGAGDTISVARLTEVLEELRAAGCHNWNLVSPTPWLPQIRAALARAVQTGPRLPVVYNSSGYERVAVLEEYAELADVYLTDLRYAEVASARGGSAADDYVAAARSALRTMWQRLGPLRCDENGIAVSGVVCRLLLLPGKAHEVVANLEWLADELGPDVPIGVMAQYVPLFKATAREGWDRKVSRAEYNLVCEAVERLGFEQGWIQEYGDEAAPELLGRDMAPGSSIGTFDAEHN